MLDTHQLNVFLMAAETLNFTQAAKRLHMTQPSVSQHVQSLEQHFNTKLFRRIGRYIELTYDGEALVPLARELVDRSVLLEETGKNIKDGSHIAKGANKNFFSVAERVKSVVDLISEISSSSNDQEKGIENLNQTVTEMNEIIEVDKAR